VASQRRTLRGSTPRKSATSWGSTPQAHAERPGTAGTQKYHGNLRFASRHATQTASHADINYLRANKQANSFRIGKVQAYRRGQIWYLCYHEHGPRHRPRVGPDKEATRQLAAQINAQLEVGSPAALSFEPIAIADVRQRWLQHHDLVLRSSVQTIHRYRTATDHLLQFLQQRPLRHACQFHAAHAEEFVRYLRTIQVAPNGHPHSTKRPLMDKGICYILECCRTLFNYAAKRRHLPPYADNPFAALEIERIPVEHVRPIALFSAEQEKAFLEACDAWQFPLFLTLTLTGLRPGELTHLLLPG
jgi:integrase